ncbi:hypothetical protein HUJ05_001853 [Dendroctonus ponderosae]|nr:hypothetical protein HUJ05_001853 [Dendroctonus ponderosae]
MNQTEMNIPSDEGLRQHAGSTQAARRQHAGSTQALQRADPTSPNAGYNLYKEEGPIETPPDASLGPATDN